MSKEEILADCLEEILNGRGTVEQSIAQYPELRDELSALLKVADILKSEEVVPAPEFKQRARRHLLEVMQTSREHAQRQPRNVPERFSGLLRVRAIRLSPIALVVISVLLIVIAAGGTAYASRSSLPGDTLYPVKRGLEKLQLALALSPEAKASEHLELAQRRTDEVISQSNLGRTISISTLEDIAREADNAIKKIAGTGPEDTKIFMTQFLKSTLHEQIELQQALQEAHEANQSSLMQALDAMRRGNLIAKVAYSNPAFLSSSPSVSDEELERSHFKLTGVLLSIEEGVWNIGGLIIKNVNWPQGTYPIGNSVVIEGLVRNDKVFLTEVKPIKQSGNEVEIEGILSDIESEGAKWYVSGIPISNAESIAPPPQGSTLTLTGIVQDGVFSVAKVESEETQELGIEIDGILVQFQDEETIVINTAGAQVNVNISEASISSEAGQTLTLSDLKSLAGKDIEIRGTYVQDGSLFAKEVHVEAEDADSPEGSPESETEQHELDQEGQRLESSAPRPLADVQTAINVLARGDTLSFAFPTS